MDFLNRFIPDGGIGGGYVHSVKKETLIDEESVELNLGLSLNGRFGVNNNYDKKHNTLIRSSSIADLSNFSSATDDTTPLTRTCSLPIETELNRNKKRKVLQLLRRSEAKRKRVEKLKNGRIVNKLSKPLSPPSSLLPPIARPSPVPSIGSPASGESSGVSDLESQPFSGTNKETELKSTGSQQSIAHKTLNSNSIIKSDKLLNENNTKDENLKTMLANMPCVMTKGEDVNGKKTEGFLYRYRKGEQVRIVCVCHGNFFTPAEFVKHGGGGDVQHPLRHIVVNPPTL